MGGIFESITLVESEIVAKESVIEFEQLEFIGHQLVYRGVNNAEKQN